jgi:hypothetical protein
MWVLILTSAVAGRNKGDVLRTHLAPVDGMFIFFGAGSGEYCDEHRIPIGDHFLMEI